MVLESAYLNVKPGLEAEFESAFREASGIIASKNGYLWHQLHRTIENPSLYLLLVGWGSLEAHTVGFRDSPEYQDWKTRLHHFYQPFPTVLHHSQVYP